MKIKLAKVVKSGWFLVLAGLVAGALIVLAIRFASYKPEEHVHYHANFAMYLNGQREEFNNPVYYTEVEESCTAEEVKMTPHERAHMHDSVNDVVHVEDEAVTWGQFFQNLGWVVDNRLIRSHDQLFVPDGDNQVTFMLNGKKTESLVNRVIGDKDKLLVSFGNITDDELQKQYQAIPATAEKYNNTPDPASCSGGKSKATMRDRLNHMF